MKPLYVTFISFLVFLPSLALSQVRIHLPGEKLGELDFGVVRRGQFVMRTASLLNRSGDDWVVPLIDVSGEGYRLMGRNFAYIAAHSQGDFLIKFSVPSEAAPGVYHGHCVIYVKLPDGTHVTYEYDLKAQVPADS